MDLVRFENLGIVKNEALYNADKLGLFETEIARIKATASWNKKEIVNLFFEMIPDFGYEEKGKVPGWENVSLVVLLKQFRFITSSK